jgi:hypothetical protein
MAAGGLAGGAALRAGIVCLAVVFAAGFALGALRVTLLVPRLGELGAMALEPPLMLLVSWLACGWLLGAFGVPRHVSTRVPMGGLGFVLPMTAELGLGTVVFGRSLAEQFASLYALPAAPGFAAQLAFGLFRLLRRATGRRC